MLKKIVLLLSVFFFVLLHSYAQAWEENTTWVYSQIVIPPTNNPVYKILRVNSDTMIQDQVFTKLNFQYFNDTIGEFSSYPNSTIFLRYENNKIYHYNTWNFTSNLIYDFTVDAGESYICYCDINDEEFEVFVDSISYYEYGNITRKIQHVSSGFQSGCELNGKIIEGMGYEDYILPVYTTVDPPPGGSIQCFNDGNFRYPTGETCLEVVNIEDLPIDDINLFPNPVSHSLVIQGGGFSTYALFSLDGRIIQQGQLSMNTIDLSSVPVGTYFIELIQERKRVFKKIVKVN
ncbi:MAG: T9SS type A sorting domain-containing protein [Saprospiraceae bacterium]|nr:T9SS type A sorting domain-containing protein [Saprospiraceae bacterium]